MFGCFFCDTVYTAVLGTASNCKPHLLKHPISKEWVDSYDLSHAEINNKISISTDVIRIVRYFITSNSAASEFDNPSFKDLLKNSSLPKFCSKTFSEVILKAVFTKVQAEIEILLQNAESVCLISDIWSSKQMLDFMGVAVNLIYDNFERETIVIGLDLMPGIHNAENIKIALENIVNCIKFDKVVISGNNF